MKLNFWRSGTKCYLVALMLGTVVFIGATRSVAQTTMASLMGHVTDSSGAIVPNAAITITDIDKNVSRTVVSNTEGDYEIPYLNPGTYRLVCRSSGFEDFAVNNVVIVGNEMRRINVQMQIGSVKTEVVVNAGAAVISTDSVQLSSGISQKDFKDSPISTNRNPSSAMVFLPMVQSQQGSPNLNVGGLPPSQIEESTDGIGTDGTVNLTNNMNTVQDLQLITSISPAEFSRAVNFTMVGKGGSNAFHGLVQWDEVNSALNARLPTSPTKPSFKTHFGVAQFGGPIRRDHTFFYVNYTFQRVPASTFYNENVPDVLQREGNFSELSTPIINPYTGIPFPGNILPSAMISSVAAAMQQNYIPLPNQGAPGLTANNYGYLFPHPTDLYKYDSWNARIDHNFSSKHSLYGSYLDRISPYVLAGSFPTVGTWTRNRYHHTIAVSDTYSFNSNLVNNFRFGWALDHIHDGIPELGITPTTGDKAVATIELQGVNPSGYKVMGFPNTTITGVSPLTQQPGGIPLYSNTYTFNDSITWVKGSHVAKFGGEIKPWTNATQQYPAGTYGTFTYDGSFTKNAYADFLLGLPRQATRLNPLVSRTSHAYEMGYYADDVFKITTNLTLSYGLRWEFFKFPTYDDGQVYNWDPTTGNVIIPKGAESKVSPLYPKNITLATGQAVPSGDSTLFRPRIGAAYRISDRFVVRGGYGMFTQVLGSVATGVPLGQSLVTTPAPFSIAETYSNQFTNGQPAFAMPNPFPSSTVSAATASQSVTGYSRNISNGIIHEFSLSVEREVHNIGFSISYAGVRARGQNYMVPQLNKPQPSLIHFTQARRPFPQFVTTAFEMHNGKSNYDALVLEAKRRMGHFSFDANYTYANNLDNTENLQNPYNLNPWNHDAYTIRNVGTVMWLYDLPFGRGQRFGGGVSGPLNTAIGGWHVNWISTFAGGQYFTPGFSGSDPSNTNTSGGVPDRICDGNLFRSQRGPSRWFNAACFAVPQPGHFGNSGSNVLEGPRFYVSNMTVVKDFSIKNGRAHITFDAMIQDLFNTPTYAFPASNISVPSQVGRISATLGGVNVGNAAVLAGGARAITARLRLEF